MAIWKARTSTGVRFYFKVVNSAGLLRVGLAPGVFTCLVIDPTDAASQVVAIAESVQQAGVYYGDVPAAFLLANGVGHYVVSIGVHAVAPRLDAETTDSLEVNVSDIDYIGAGVAGAVWDEVRAAHVVPGTFGEGVNLTAAERTAVATALLDLANGIENNWTLRETLRIILSSAAAKTRDFQINAPKFRDVNDTKDRITGTQDGNGNRTAVVYNKA